MAKVTLTKIYRALLDAVNFQATDDDCISLAVTEDRSDWQPVLVKGKRLVLPTHHHLTKSDPEQIVVFHPLYENPMKGESDVLEKFRGAANTRLNTDAATIFTSLLTLGTSPADHAKLSPDQAEFLAKLKNADEGTLERFNKILRNLKRRDLSKFFVSLYVKWRGTHNGVKFARLGVVAFPFYSELKAGSKEIHGVSLRKADVAAFIALHEYIFPACAEQGSYNAGSNSRIAPTIEALMASFGNVAADLNAVTNLFEGALGAKPVESEWVDYFKNLEQYEPLIHTVPMQTGNEGGISAKQQEVKAEEPDYSDVSVRIALDQPEPVKTVAMPTPTLAVPAARETKPEAPAAEGPGGFKIHNPEALRRLAQSVPHDTNNTGIVQRYLETHKPVMPLGMQPNGYMQQPTTPVQTMTASGTVDFGAVLRNRPDLAQQAGVNQGMNGSMGSMNTGWGNQGNGRVGMSQGQAMRAQGNTGGWNGGGMGGGFNRGGGNFGSM